MKILCCLQWRNGVDIFSNRYVYTDLFQSIRDEKRTILVDWLHEDMIIEIWKHERQEAGEGIDNRPQILRKASEISLLKDRREYKGVSYWVIEFSGSSRS